MAVFGLFIISIGTGGIKPCVFAFGGDQFQLPQQKKQLLHYTTVFLFIVSVGALISTFLTPELRHSVHCLGRDTCFPLAFGVPALLMFTAIGIYYYCNINKVIAHSRHHVHMIKIAVLIHCIIRRK